jgi:hypothetical protein
VTRPGAGPALADHGRVGGAGGPIRVSTDDLGEAKLFAAQAPTYLLEIAASLRHALRGAAEGAGRPDVSAALHALSAEWVPVVQRMAGEAQYLADGIEFAIAVYREMETSATSVVAGGGGSA